MTDRASIFRPPYRPKPLSRPRNGPGNLTDLGLTLYYPGAVDKNGNRIPMPSNLNDAAICGAGQTMGVDPCITGISPTALKIANALPSPNLPGQANGTINNLSNSVDTYTHGNQGDIKVDWMPDDKDRIMARYSQQHVENPTMNSQPLLYSGSGSNIFPLQQAVLDYTRTFSSTFVNDVRIGMNYFPADANIQGLSTTAGAGLIPGQPTQYLPGLSFANIGDRRRAQRTVRVRHQRRAGDFSPNFDPVFRRRHLDQGRA